MTTADWTLLLCVPLLPLAGFGAQIFLGRRLPGRGAPILVGAMGLAAAIALVQGFRFIGADVGELRSSVEAGFSWNFLWTEATPGTPNVAFGLLFDNLSAIMLAAVAPICFLIHLYSVGYMQGDRRYHIYFANISLFTAGMLGLILSDNFLSFFICWELMGFCSYSLIGHFHDKPSAAAACKKAFLTTRVGDVCLFLGVAILFSHYDTVAFSALFAGVQETLAATGGEYPGWLVAAGLLIFMGAVGKSAQFPLHIWLPDAMEGPTPVSAMIHAATMVAAGVYLTARAAPFFSEEVFVVVALVGSFTAIFAALIGICATDIKKVLAYSTISQLGFMIAAIGVGGWVAGLFHMVTHAFFKACLFLGSGSVIHAVHTQEMPEMGGLRRKMPITYGTMLVSTLAIAGVPLFAGFYSKDSILAAALGRAQSGGGLLDTLPAVFLFVAAGITAFYMFRLMILTFHGAPRDQEKFDHAHESPSTMTIPLVVLGLGAVFSGSLWIANGDVLGHHPWFPGLVSAPTLSGLVPVAPAIAEHAHGQALWMSVAIGAAGIALAFSFYQWGVFSAEAWAKRLGPLYRAVSAKFWIDEIVNTTVVRLTVIASAVLGAFDRGVVDGLVNLVGWGGRKSADLAGFLDKHGVDGLVNSTALATQALGAGASTVQSGRIQQYLLFTVLGAVALGAWILVR